MTAEATSSCRLDGETRVIEPERIQLRRVKGWRIPENTIVVSRPSKWGNVYGFEQIGGGFVSKRDNYVAPDKAGILQHVTWRFRQALLDGRLSFTIEDVRRELKGRNLACWCKLPEPGQPDHCHARVLLDIAAGEESGGLRPARRDE